MGLVLMNVVTNILDTALVFYFLIRIFHKRNINKKRSIILLSIVILINTLINQVFGLADTLGFILIFILSNTVYSILVSEKLTRTLAYSILGTVIMFGIELITVMLLVLICNIKPSAILEVNIYKIIGVVIAKGSYYLIIKYLLDKLKIPRHMKFKNIKSILLIGSFNILIISMTFTLYKNIEIDSIFGYLYLIGMGAGAIIFSWIIYSTSKKMIYQYQQETIWKIKEDEFYKKDFYVKSMKDILQTIRSQRHDLNNYLSTLYGLIFLEDFEDAKTYITKINDRVSNMNKIIETNHPVITALVSMKKNKAFEENIDMNLDIDMPDELPFDFVDISIVIGNLLDNAIEACLLVDENSKRKIELFISVKETYLKIQVSNTKSKKIKLDNKDIMGRFTTKTDQDNHGFGLGNIEFIVNQYDGTMNVEDLGIEFKVNIKLPMEIDHNYGV